MAIISRSISDGILRGICPFCLGHVGLSLVCWECKRDCTTYDASIQEIRVGGKMRLEALQKAAVRKAEHP